AIPVGAIPPAATRTAVPTADTRASLPIPVPGHDREEVIVAPTPPPPEPVTVADPVKDRILALVSEKTGYPIDMLDPELDLEADLGVDTVKQAEIFAAIRETYNIPRDEHLKLRDFPTLAHVIQFVYDNRPDLALIVSEPLAEPPSAA